MNRPTRLILGGSGTNFFAYIGALKCIQYSMFYNIVEVIGVSGGSLIGSLFCAGYTPRQIEKIVCNIEFDKLIDRNLLPVLYSQGYGLIKGNKILEILKQYLPKDFDNLIVDLSILVTSLTDKRLIVLNKNNKLNFELPEAVRASMSIPNLFSFVSKNDKIYMDGGIFNNYPVDIESNIYTIGIKADSHSNTNNGIKNIFHYNNIIIDCLLESRKIKAVEDSKNTKHIHILVDNDCYDLNIPLEKKKELIKAGYEQTKRALNV